VSRPVWVFCWDT